MHRIPRLAFALGLLAAGCAQASGWEAEWQRRHTPPPGSSVVLRQAVEIPAHEGLAYIQDGRTLPYADVDPFRPHCALELRGVPRETYTVPPGRYPIVKVVHEEDDALTQAPGAGVVRVGLRLAGGPSYWLYATSLYLARADRPEVWRLRCGHWEDPSLDPRFLTLDEVRATLGPLGTLAIP